MKVLSAECYGGGADVFELDILHHLARTNQDHTGSTYVSHLVHSFEHEGPNGRHMCLVFKVMGETLATFKTWFPTHTIPNPLLQRFTSQLLQALDFAHKCGVIHTGNRMLTPCAEEQS